MNKGLNYEAREYFTKSALMLFSLILFLFSTQQAQTQVNRSSITITTEPSATVWIDDIRFGLTDSAGKLAIKGLSGARHTVRVRADGFKETTKSLIGVQSQINIPLIKTSDPAQLAFQEAERLLLSDRSQAADAYRKAIKLRPTYVAAYIGLARVLSDSGDADGARKAILNLRKFSPRNAEASAVEGRIYKDNGDEDKAIASFKRSITEGGGFQPEAYTGLGLLYKERAETFAGAGNFADEDTNYKEASKNFAAAIKQLSTAPDAMIVYQLLGLVYERQKRYPEAIRLYNDFLALFPDSNDATAVRSFIDQIKKQMAQP